MCLHRLPEVLAALAEDAAANRPPEMPDIPAPAPSPEVPGTPAPVP